jgi:4-aminobutyrate--pyruvate transaminase
MDMLGHVREVGPRLQDAAKSLSDHPLVGDVRGVGMIAALEMVADKDTRAPFDAALKVGATVEKYAREHGLIARFIGDRIAFSPPLIITAAEIDEIMARLRRALDDAKAELRL